MSILFGIGGGVSDHGGLTGLSDDDHTIYALLLGRSGGQTLIGGTAASNNLTLQSTSNATRGVILGNDTFSSPGAGASSERYGASAVAAGASSLALGNAASSASANGIAIGASCVIGTGTTNLGIGKSLTINNGTNNCIAIGHSLSVPTGCASSIFLGLAQTISSGATGCTLLGSSVTCTGNNAVGFGYNSTVSAENFAIGFSSTATGGTRCMSLGNFCQATPAGGYAMCVGDSAKSDQIGTMVFGDYDNTSSGGLYYTTNAAFFGWATATDKFYFGHFAVSEVPPADWAYISCAPTIIEDSTAGNVWLHGGLSHGASATAGKLVLGTGVNSGALTIQTVTSRLEFVSLTASTGEMVFNQDGRSDYDARFEGDTNANLLFIDASADKIGIGTNGPTALLHIAPTAATGATSPILLTTGAAHTAQTASTEKIDLDFNLARTVQWATGALTTQRFALFRAPTIGFVGASTLTDTATVAITGAPVKGTNATLTRTHGLLIEAGAVSTAATAYGLRVLAPTGATTNICAQFDNLSLTGNTLSSTNTNGNILIVPNGNGAIQTRSTGNTRGTNAIDLQFSGASATNVASGANSAILSGTNNTASGARAVVLGGSGNTASGSDCVVMGGTSNTASGNTSFIGGGVSNTASATYSAVLAGNTHNVSGQSAAALAGNNYASGFQNSIGAGFSSDYLLQWTRFNMQYAMLSTDGTSFVEVTNPERLDGLATDYYWAIDVRIAGMQTDGSNAAYYHRKCILKNVSGTVSLSGTVQTMGTDIETDAAWDIQLTADNTNKGLKIEVKGNSQDISWAVDIDWIQMQFNPGL